MDSGSHPWRVRNDDRVVRSPLRIDRRSGEGQNPFLNRVDVILGGHDEAAVLDRVRHLLAQGSIVTHSGRTLAMRPRSILVHGDTPGAVELARTIRAEIEAGGGRIVPISRQAGLT